MNNRESRAGAKLVPVGGDEQHHPAGQQDGAKDQRDHALPAKAAGLFLLLLKGADAGSGSRIQDAGRLPAI